MNDSNDNKGQLPTVSHPTSDEGMKTPAEMPDIEGYRIIDKIGEGGMATVWRAVQLSTQRAIALKVLGAGTFGSKKARVRFEREVELTARLEHPNIARIYESGLHRGGYYYAMELFEGEHLDKYILGHQLTQRKILELFYTVCQAVQYAHQQGVIHRDLKPSNIVVTDDGQPHVLDFGLAKALLESDKDLTVSVDGDIAGTPAYMSPEQASGHFDSIDTRTDVYSIGVILFNVLTNQWPYDISGSQYEVLKNIQEQEPIRPSKIVPHFDSDIEAILLKAIAKKSGERYQSITELAHDIHNWLHGFPVLARSVNTWYLLKKLMVRNAAATIVVCLLLVIIVNTSFISSYSYIRARAALKKSQLMEQAFKVKSERNLAVANQAVFTLFLEFWHDGKIERAQGAAGFFAENSRERTAALFLLDQRPLNEKKNEFNEKLFVENPSFGAFILGEYNVKNKNISEAIEAYKRCLNTEGQDTEANIWFRNRAQVKLDELLNEKITPPLDGDIKGAQ
jgi:serine/threonine protein kinase